MMNPELQRERSKATFCVAALTNLLDGSPQQTQRRRYLEGVIAQDPVFSNADNIYLSRQDRHVRAVAKAVRLVEACRKLGIAANSTEEGLLFASEDWRMLLNAVADDLPLALHWIMFTPNIISLCDAQQQAEWLPLCRDFRMIGCYAQTELGHGSNIRALETTATFVSEAQGGMPGGSFVIHSPTLTSAKAWPGTMGRIGTHAMVIAQLMDGQGIHRGIHNFLVPLRSTEDHKPLPGVTAIDLGPKLGFNNIDNGFCRFDHVMIPRRNMAMKFSEVDEHGTYRKKKQASKAASKIAYITMMQVRAYMIQEASKHLGMACTIAIRYSAVRLQGYRGENNNGEEMQILDYRQQQHRLLTLLAYSYCFFFSGKKVLHRLNEMEANLSSSPNNSTTMSKEEATDIHASSSALKCCTSTIATDGLEDCRKACGGHGFLQSSGLPELVCTYLHHATVEGDNHMLPQQVLKVLLKMVQTLQAGGDANDYRKCDCGLLIPSIMAILQQQTQGTTPIQCRARSEQDMQSLPLLLSAFEHRAARLLLGVAQHIQTATKTNGKSPLDAWNDALLEMGRTTHAYAQYLLLRNFVAGIQEEEEEEEKASSRDTGLGPNEIRVLTNLATLCGVSWMERGLGDFVEDGYVTAQQAHWVRSSVLKLLDLVRPNAVALVDAFDISDFRLKSVLGRYDGDVYPALLEAAMKDPLNQSEPGPGYEPHLKRLIKDGVGAYACTTSRL